MIPPQIKIPFFSKHALQCAAEVAALLSTDLQHHYTISKLARKVGLNSRSLQECFKHVYGSTIFVFGQHARLEQSKKLLIETDFPTQVIAEECGYHEQSNFSAAFKKKYGVGPGEWKRRSVLQQIQEITSSATNES
jgi:AraC-like DNA-binding protein